jgi:hypothetical protein
MVKLKSAVRMRSRYFILMFFAGILAITSYAQQPSATLYHMAGIPQRSFLNPAFQPEAGGFTAMPGFGMINLQVGNSGFNYSDIVVYTDTGKTISFDKILGSMPSVNRLYAEFSYQPVAFGFRFLKKGYFTFDMGPRTSVQFFYPKDLFGLAIKGNGHEDYLGKRISFDNMGMEVSFTNDVSIGYSHQIFNGFTLGVRGRFIQGLVNLHTEKFILGLTTDEESFHLTADADVKVSTSVPEFLLDTAALRNNATSWFIDQTRAYLKKNQGWGLDIGASYKVMDRLLISASINDLGYIKWGGDPVNISSKGEYTFTGLDFSGMIQGNDMDEQVDKLLDSIRSIFSPDTTYLPYTQRLVPSLNIGAGFYITRDDVVGAHLRNQFYNGLWFPQITFSYNHRFGRVLSLSGSYGLERGSYTNLGVGMALKLGSFQYYLITDNLMAFAFPLSARSVNVVTGINWLFRHKPEKISTPSI